MERGNGDLTGVRRLGIDRFTAAVRRELPRWDATRLCLRIVRTVYAAARSYFYASPALGVNARFCRRGHSMLMWPVGVGAVFNSHDRHDA